MLKFDETPNYEKFSKMLSDLDGGVHYYLAESKIKFMKAAYKLISSESVAKQLGVEVKKKVDRSVAKIIKLMAKKILN